MVQLEYRKSVLRVYHQHSTFNIEFQMTFELADPLNTYSAHAIEIYG